LRTLVLSCLFGLSVASRPWNMRQFPATIERRVDGQTVFGTINNVDENVAKFDPTQVAPDEATEFDISNNLVSNEVIEPEEPGFIDSVFGDGVQARIVDSVNGWIVGKAKSNPGCVERFVCETYRTGESLEGVPYVAMSLTNAAVSFMVADMFDQSIDIQEITKAARQGRTIGTCHQMQCDILDGQLRNLEGYFEVVESFFSTIYNSVAGSFAWK